MVEFKNGDIVRLTRTSPEWDHRWGNCLHTGQLFIVTWSLTYDSVRIKPLSKPDNWVSSSGEVAMNKEFLKLLK